MRHSIVAAVVLAITASPAAAGTGQITGTVVDENGAPAKHVKVEAWPLDTGNMGPLPVAETDDFGHFVMRVVVGRDSKGRPYGLRWDVYPRIDMHTYRPPLWFFHTNNSQAVIATLTERHPEATVTIRLGPKAGALVGKVTDALTGAPVKPYFEFAWASDPHNTMSESMSPNYRILLPSNTGITFWVGAEGHKRYTYPGVINVRPGQDFRLDIQLQPEPKQLRND